MAEASLRTVQRVLTPLREEARAKALATVRFETAPGHQMQIDFGEKQVVIAGAPVKVFLFVAVLGYSRRLFVRASLSQRQDDWREGLASAFRHFGGVPQRLLIDNAGAMVNGREGDHAVLHPAFAAFCKDWGVSDTTLTARQFDDQVQAIRLKIIKFILREKTPDVMDAVYAAATIPDENGKYNTPAQKLWLQFVEEWTEVLGEADKQGKIVINFGV